MVSTGLRQYDYSICMLPELNKDERKDCLLAVIDIMKSAGENTDKAEKALDENT